MARTDERVIIQCAVTGSQPITGKNPALPGTPAEVADSAIEAWRAGASLVHIHAREEDGTPTPSLDRFREIVERVQASGCDAILNLTCGWAGGYAHGTERLQCLELDPEMASYDAGSVNMRDTVFPNTVPFLREMGEAFLERKVLPEVEVFEAGHIDTALRLRDEGVLEDPLHFNLVLGVRGGAPGTIAQAVFMLSMLPDDASWSICGLGRTQLPLNVFGLVAGGHVRTGLEDNMNYARGELATNPQLVERIVRIATEVGRPVASPAEAREILSLPR